MKTRRILAASTAALLSMASVAVVANATVTAVEVEYSKDWEVAGTGQTTTDGEVFYKIKSADAKKFAGVTISAQVDGSVDLTDSSDSVYDAATPAGTDEKGDPTPAVPAGTLGELKSTMQTKLQNAAANGAVLVDITVGPEAPDDYETRKDFTCPATIQINVQKLGFEANHVYHVNGKNLEEVEIVDLTKDATKYGIVFETKSFSPFIITKDAVKGAIALDDEDNTANVDNDSSATSDGTSNANNGNNSETGIALAIAPVVLAAGAVAVVAIKKKH